LKRPDIAIFCEEPPDQDEALEEIPEAVLEVLSKDYEKKDTEIGAPFYLKQGVKDVILFDPRTREVTHRRRDGDRLLKSPVPIQLECGCQITVIRRTPFCNSSEAIIDTLSQARSPFRIS